MTREEVPAFVTSVLRRDARWAEATELLVAYDGHQRTMLVFEVEAREQMQMLEAVHPHQPALEAAAGGPIVFIFFTASQTQRRRARGRL